MKYHRKILALIICIATAIIMTPPASRAGTNGFLVPTFRGSANSQAGYWELFTVAHGAPGNAADEPGATTAAVLTQTDTNAFLTGSGNIYNLGTSSFALTDSVPYTLGTVVLQTRTVGSEIEYETVSLIASTSSGEQTVEPLFRHELDRTAGQGSNVSSLWQWDLTGLGVQEYRVAFQAAGPSLSFDALTLDTADGFEKAFAQQPFHGHSVPATLARWMYPFNADPASRATASVFGALGSTPDFDSRDAQFLLGWTTTDLVPAGQGTNHYLVRRARVTLTIASGGQYRYTGALRDYRTYFPTNDPRYLPPAMGSSPVELFGVGYRGGFTAATYPQDGPWAADPDGGFYTNRAAYAAGYDTNGALVDVSNNVGDDGTNEIAGAFEVAPFAVGQSDDVAPGELMPAGSQLTFDLNLEDPLIYGYVQQGLHEGNLSFVVSSLIGATFMGPPTYPNFHTIFSPLATPEQFPLLELEGAVLRPDVDGDRDGMPDDWENFHFASLGPAGDGDADGDGASNAAESRAGSDPTDETDSLRLLTIEREGDVARLKFIPAPNRNYSVGWTDDFGTWQTITNAAVSYQSDWLTKTTTHAAYPSPVHAVWVDSDATGERRFYRIQTP